MFLMIDNYDSFVYNLAAYFQELGEEIHVLRCDAVTAAEVEAMAPQGVIFSPGPRRPQDAVLCNEIFQRFYKRLPLLGVCLGHQVIGAALGGKAQKGELPVHGKVTPIQNNGGGLFCGLPQTFQVTRYHSLVVDFEPLPQEVSIDAVAENGVVMGLSHRRYPVFGVQFHPEAVLTEYGHELLRNYIEKTKEWWKIHGTNNQSA